MSVVAAAAVQRGRAAGRLTLWQYEATTSYSNTGVPPSKIGSSHCTVMDEQVDATIRTSRGG